MKTIIVVRTDMKWDSPREIYNQPTKDKPKKAIAGIKRKSTQEFWDKHFTLPYHEYRKHTKTIAMESLQALNVPILVGMPAFNAQVNTLSEDTYVVPIDDDDWINPSLPEYLSNRETLHAGIWWKMWYLRPSGLSPCQQTRQPESVATAIKVGTLRSMKPVNRNRMVAYHWMLGRFLFNKTSYPGSVHVCHPASASYLIYILMKHKKPKRLIDALAEEKEIPEAVEWCRPYYQKTLSLLQSSIR